MATRTSRPRVEPREPIRMPALWVAVTATVLIGVPLYLPEGTIDPIVLGVPLWLLVCVVAAVALSAILCVACLRWWSLAEPAEAAAEFEEDAR
ncbi:hypothetical protein [Solicola gregarius]|uniref:Uncharacterized protein n=1 Tax=Solicola gregarius TaxID=2908642 RepID=A0AA46TEU2_9ACTN|nr:hypothetical protein [Solicola gregarius]UYM03888.1 hypothetical protein L0C25_15210 [Solicola gregarius]